MMTYMVRRILLFIPTLVMVSIIIFGMTRALPGDAVDLMLEDSPHVRAEDREALRDYFGLNDPIHIQYVIWMGQVVRGDFGKSLWTGSTIREEMSERLPVTVQLSVMALGMSLLIALPLGIISAVKQDSWVDHVARVSGILALSVPNFVLGTLALTYLALWFNWIPPIGYVSFFEDPWANFLQFILPASILGASMAGSVSRMTRSTVLEVLRQDYVRTARAKGLSGDVVMRRHILRNALNPIITISALQLGGLLSGTLIIEVMFAMPGLGRLMFAGIIQRDYAMVQGIILFAALVFLAVNLLVDIIYKFVDPRIDYA